MKTTTKTRTFRPSLTDTLESRVVPSAIHPVAHLSHAASTPVIVHRIFSQNGPRGLGTHNLTVTTNRMVPHTTGAVHSAQAVHASSLTTTAHNTTSTNGPRGLGTNFGPGTTNAFGPATPNFTTTPPVFTPASGSPFSSNGPRGLGTNFGAGTTN